MDVSGWTIDQRMRFPDYCFGQQQAIGLQVYCPNALIYYFGISEIALPDPACIWQFSSWFKISAAANNTFRIGLAATVPTTIAEMDLALEIFPYIGGAYAGPNKLRVTQRYSTPWVMNIRKGLVTNGLKIVVALYSTVADTTGDFVLIVSGLPTNMAGWLAHNKV